MSDLEELCTPPPVPTNRKSMLERLDSVLQMAKEGDRPPYIVIPGANRGAVVFVLGNDDLELEPFTNIGDLNAWVSSVYDTPAPRFAQPPRQPAMPEPPTSRYVPQPEPMQHAPETMIGRLVPRVFGGHGR